MCAKVGPEAISPRARIDAYFFFAETCARSATSHRQKSVPSTFTFFPIDFFFEKKYIYACRDMSEERHVASLLRHGQQPRQERCLHSAAEETVVLCVCTLIQSLTHTHTHIHIPLTLSLLCMRDLFIYLSIYLSPICLSIYLCVFVCVCVHTRVCACVDACTHNTDTQTHTCSMYLLKVRRIVLDGPRPICPQFGPATNTSTVGYCCSR